MINSRNGNSREYNSRKTGAGRITAGMGTAGKLEPEIGSRKSGAGGGQWGLWGLWGLWGVWGLWEAAVQNEGDDCPKWLWCSAGCPVGSAGSRGKTNGSYGWEERMSDCRYRHYPITPSLLRTPRPGCLKWGLWSPGRRLSKMRWSGVQNELGMCPKLEGYAPS
jgi:hypothetical protein